MEEFDLSTKDGFLRDFDSLEKAVLKARNQIGEEITDEILDNTLKKRRQKNHEKKSEIESELGRIPVCVLDSLAQSIQPKQRLCSIGYLQLASKLCTELSYRDSTEIINLFQHRDEFESVKLRTFSDSMNRMGSRISDTLTETSEKILKMYVFDSETGHPMEGVCLSQNLTSPNIEEKTEADIQTLNSMIKKINTSHEEKIPFKTEELDIEHESSECVYVSIDDIGVKYQKERRGKDDKKAEKYVENTVVYI